jgi:hypothetical protein
MAISQMPANCGALFFIGSFENRAPISLRNKIDDESIENLKTSIQSFYGNPLKTKIVYKSYTQFRRNLEEIGINLKHYIE